jgi:hypothetical protein
LARYSYNPVTLTCNGQLIEETRTNLFLNSLIDGTNLSTQSVTLSAVAYTMSFYGSGSITISGGHSATVAGIGDFPNRKTYTFTPASGSSTFTVSGEVKFAQIEAGGFATSFVPTGASSVTRNADVVSVTGANFSSWFNTTEGAFLYAADFFNTATFPPILSVSDNTLNNRYACAGGVQFHLFVAVNGAAQVSFDNGTISANVLNKYAWAYKTNNFAGSLNGGAPATDSAATLPNVNRMYVGAGSDGAAYLNGFVRKILYWPQRLTNAEVQAFSK